MRRKIDFNKSASQSGEQKKNEKFINVILPLSFWSVEQQAALS